MRWGRWARRAHWLRWFRTNGRRVIVPVVCRAVDGRRLLVPVEFRASGARPPAKSCWFAFHRLTPMLFLLQLELGLGLVPCLDLDPRAGILAVFAMHVPFAGAAENHGKLAHLDLHLLGHFQSQEHEAWAQPQTDTTSGLNFRTPTCWSALPKGRE